MSSVKKIGPARTLVASFQAKMGPRIAGRGLWGGPSDHFFQLPLVFFGNLGGGEADVRGERKPSLRIMRSSCSLCAL